MKRKFRMIAVISIMAMLFSCIPMVSFGLTAPGTVTITSAYQSSLSTKSVIKWKKHTNTAVKGYEVYAKKGSGSYVKIKTITSRYTVSCYSGYQTAGYTYYYKVRAYKKTSSGKKVYGKFSAAKAVKITAMSPQIHSSTVLNYSQNSDSYTVEQSFRNSMAGATIYIDTSSDQAAGIYRELFSGDPDNITIDNPYKETTYYAPIYITAYKYSQSATWIETYSDEVIRVASGQTVYLQFGSPSNLADLDVFYHDLTEGIDEYGPYEDTYKGYRPWSQMATGFNFITQGAIDYYIEYKNKTYLLAFWFDNGGEMIVWDCYKSGS